MRQVKHPEVNWFDWNAYHADCFVAYARMSLLSMKEAVTRTLFDFLKDVVENVRDAPAPSDQPEKKKRTRKPKPVELPIDAEEED